MSGAQRLNDVGDQRTQVLHAVTNACDEDDGDSDGHEILLVAQSSIGREDDTEASIYRRAKQHAVSQTQPLFRSNG